MGFCHAKNCRHTTANKFRLFRFPRDALRRNIWIERCGKPYATQFSRLCEYHFDDSQYEQRRADGWKKLKPNAVPTIFNHNDKIVKKNNLKNGIIDANNEPIAGSSLQNIIQLDEKNGIHIDDNSARFDEYIADSDSDIDINRGISILNKNSRQIILKSSARLSRNCNNNTSELVSQSNESSEHWKTNEIKSLKLQLVYLEQRNLRLKEKLKNQRTLNYTINKQLKSYKTKYTDLIGRFQQIPIFKEFTTGLMYIKPKWSTECLNFANQIRKKVSWKGYIFLIKKLGLPLPSYATLCRHTCKLNANIDNASSKQTSTILDEANEVALNDINGVVPDDTNGTVSDKTNGVASKDTNPGDEEEYFVDLQMLEDDENTDEILP